MAHSLILQSAAYQLDLLDATAHKVLYDADLGIPMLEHFFGSPSGRLYNPLGSYHVGNREIILPVVMAGSTMDNLIVATQQVQAVLNEARRFHSGEGGAAAELTIKPNGATNTTVFDVIEGKLNLGRFFNPALSAFFIFESTIILTVVSYGRTQQLRSNASGNLNNGGGTGATGGTYTLTKPTSGEVPGPCIVEVQTAAGDTWERLILAKISRGDVADIAGICILQCEEGSFTGYTVTDIEASANFSMAAVAVAAASGGNVERVTATGADGAAYDILRWELTGPLASIRGRYGVWLRIDDTATANTPTATLKWGGTDGLLRSNSPYTFQDDVDVIGYLGEIEIPSPGAAGGVINSFLMVLNMDFDFSGAATCDLDCLYLIPLDDEMLDVQFGTGSSPTAAQDIMVSDFVDWHPREYLVDSSGNYKLLTRGIPWVNTGFTRSVDNDDLYIGLLLDAATIGGTVYYYHNLTHIFTINVKDFPRLNYFDA